MKRYDNLFDKICQIDNFRIAYINATRCKHFYNDVKLIEQDRENYLSNLLNEVINDTYKVSDYTKFKIWSGGKMREIYKLPMRDRIILHAIMIYLEPIFRETFIIDTFSSIKGRGTHLGLKRVKQKLRKFDYKYCLKLDVHKCYPSLDLTILKQKLAKKFKDERLLNLLYKIVDSCDKGVPIGNYTSLYFNNFYFSDFDHWIKETKHIKAYFRYCDDIVILGNDKAELHLLFEEITKYMLTLNITLKSNHLIFNIEDRSIDFLGYKIRKNYVLIRNRTKYNFIKKCKSFNFQLLDSKLVNCLGSYWGILKHANCRNLWKKYTNSKKFHLKKCGNYYSLEQIK